MLQTLRMSGNETIQLLKKRMQEKAVAGEYEAANHIKGQIIEAVKNQRSEVIRSLLKEEEIFEKRLQEATKAELEDLEDACKCAIVKELRKYKAQVEAAKSTFEETRLKESERAQGLIAAGPRISPKYTEMRDIEKIRASEGDFVGARYQQQLSKKYREEAVAKFNRSVEENLVKKLKKLKSQLLIDLQRFKIKLEEEVQLIESETKHKKEFVTLKSKTRRPPTPKIMS
jgi:hypothetical protein